MARVLRPIAHEERLSIIDHLDELRSRLIVCGIGLAIAFAFCFWQNQLILKALNRALPATPATSANHISGLTGDTVKEAHALKTASSYLHQLAASGSQSAHDKALFGGAASALASAAASLPSQTAKRLPITIGVGEPFTTTLLAAAYFALLLSLPLIIYQAYAFVIPALDANERRIAIPVMLVAPALFLMGVVFAYFVVLPPAVHFLQGYNSGNFDILVQAKTYYQFQIFTMLGIGLIFQLPLGLLALQAMGRISSRTLTRNWRYAVVIIAVIAAALPGADPVTTGLETTPLVILYLASIVMLKIADRRRAKRAAEELTAEVSQGFDAS